MSFVRVNLRWTPSIMHGARHTILVRFQPPQGPVRYLETEVPVTGQSSYVVVTEEGSEVSCVVVAQMPGGLPVVSGLHTFTAEKAGVGLSAPADLGSEFSGPAVGVDKASGGDVRPQSGFAGLLEPEAVKSALAAAKSVAAGAESPKGGKLETGDQQLANSGIVVDDQHSRRK